MPIQGPGNLRTGVYPKTAPAIPNINDLASPQGGMNGLQALLSQIGGKVPGGWASLIPYVLMAGGAAIDAVHESPREKIMRELFEERAQRLEDTRRRARGKFTGAETQDVLNNPGLNRTASNVAMAGLEGSGAGQQILSDAMMGAFDAAQDRASAELTGLEESTWSMAQQFYDEDEDFAGLVGQFSTLWQANQLTGQQDNSMKQTNALITQMLTLAQSTQAMTQQMTQMMEK